MPMMCSRYGEARALVQALSTLDGHDDTTESMGVRRSSSMNKPTKQQKMSSSAIPKARRPTSLNARSILDSIAFHSIQFNSNRVDATRLFLYLFISTRQNNKPCCHDDVRNRYTLKRLLPQK
mmetsp:Transcript_26053/g.71456  ORF Transcript_26053/g.71456 Transcript_26053/m.71456 type:complete len:122 (+) Transcript_26053:1298-1663(+)